MLSNPTTTTLPAESVSGRYPAKSSNLRSRSSSGVDSLTLPRKFKLPFDLIHQQHPPYSTTLKAPSLSSRTRLSILPPKAVNANTSKSSSLGQTNNNSSCGGQDKSQKPKFWRSGSLRYRRRNKQQSCDIMSQSLFEPNQPLHLRNISQPNPQPILVSPPRSLSTNNLVAHISRSPSPCHVRSIHVAAKNENSLCLESFRNSQKSCNVDSTLILNNPPPPSRPSEFKRLPSLQECYQGDSTEFIFDETSTSSLIGCHLQSICSNSSVYDSFDENVTVCNPYSYCSSSTTSVPSSLEQRPQPGEISQYHPPFYDMTNNLMSSNFNQSSGTAAAASSQHHNPLMKGMKPVQPPIIPYSAAGPPAAIQGGVGGSTSSINMNESPTRRKVNQNCGVGVAPPPRRDSISSYSLPKFKSDKTKESMMLDCMDPSSSQMIMMVPMSSSDALNSSSGAVQPFPAPIHESNCGPSTNFASSPGQESYASSSTASCSSSHNSSSNRQQMTNNMNSHSAMFLNANCRNSTTSIDSGFRSNSSAKHLTHNIISNPLHNMPPMMETPHEQYQSHHHQHQLLSSQMNSTLKSSTSNMMVPVHNHHPLNGHQNVAVVNKINSQSRLDSNNSSSILTVPLDHHNTSSPSGSVGGFFNTGGLLHDTSLSNTSAHFSTSSTMNTGKSIHSSTSSLATSTGGATTTTTTTADDLDSISTFNIHDMIASGVSHDEILNAWLSDMGFEEYFELFVSSGYDLHTISRMTPEDLTAIGVKKPNHRKKIKNEIDRLDIHDGLPTYIPTSVEEWLLLIRMTEYLPSLHHEGYTSLQKIVSQLTLDDLEDVGIFRLGHQKRFVMAIKRIKDIKCGRFISSTGPSNLRDSSSSSISCRHLNEEQRGGEDMLNPSHLPSVSAALTTSLHIPPPPQQMTSSERVMQDEKIRGRRIDASDPSVIRNSINMTSTASVLPHPPPHLLTDYNNTVEGDCFQGPNLSSNFESCIQHGLQQPQHSNAEPEMPQPMRPLSGLPRYSSSSTSNSVAAMANKRLSSNSSNSSSATCSPQSELLPRIGLGGLSTSIGFAGGVGLHSSSSSRQLCKSLHTSPVHQTHITASPAPQFNVVEGDQVVGECLRGMPMEYGGGLHIESDARTIIGKQLHGDHSTYHCQSNFNTNVCNSQPPPPPPRCQSSQGINYDPFGKCSANDRQSSLFTTTKTTTETGQTDPLVLKGVHSAQAGPSTPTCSTATTLSSTLPRRAIPVAKITGNARKTTASHDEGDDGTNDTKTDACSAAMDNSKDELMTNVAKNVQTNVDSSSLGSSKVIRTKKNAGDVLNDIGCMLADLTYELDNMLLKSSQEGGGQ